MSPQNRLVPIKSKSHEIQIFSNMYPVSLRIIEQKYLPVVLHFKAENAVQIVFDLFSDFMKFSFIRSENHHVVHIANIIDGMKLLFNIVIQLSQIPVGKPLRCIKTNGNASITRNRIYNFKQDLQKSPVMDQIRELFFQSIMRDGIKILLNVHFETVFTILPTVPNPFLNPFLSKVRSSAWNRSVRVFIHGLHKYRLQNIYDHMVNNLFLHGWDNNLSLFPSNAIINQLWFVLGVMKILGVDHEIWLHFFDMIPIKLHSSIFSFLSAFAFGSVLHAEIIVFVRYKLFVKMIVRFHNSLLILSSAFDSIRWCFLRY